MAEDLYNMDMETFILKRITKEKEMDFHIESGVVNGDFLLHTHDFCEIFFILSGSGIHVAGDQAYQLQKGEMFAVKGREYHGFTDCRELHIVNIMFHPSGVDVGDCRSLPGFWVLFLHEQAVGNISHLYLEGENFETVKRWCYTMLEEYGEKKAGYLAVCRAVLIQLVTFLSRACQQIPENIHRMDFRLARAVSYMETIYSRPVSLEELARTAGFSPRHFSRLFKDFYGLTPMRYLLNLRIRRAKELLWNEELEITEIAGMCGFQDENYFSRIFREETGRSPSQWRKEEKERSAARSPDTF